LIELNYVSMYDKTLGFRFGLNGLVGNEERGLLYQVIASVVPPASPYLKDNKSIEFANPFVSLDLNSSEDAVKFVD